MEDTASESTASLMIAAVCSVALLWMSQPPCMWWPLAMVALIPWLHLIANAKRISKRQYLILWSASTFYWLISLQGLRHAHWAMCIPWLALGGYLATYHLLFIAVVRKLISQRIPLTIAVPVVWVGQECIRNYLLTGISAIMLGHATADVPLMIQIADVFGTYGVSFVIAMVNVAVYSLAQIGLRRQSVKGAAPSVLAAAVVLAVTIAYGHHRLQQPLGDPAATFALIQRDEPVEYGQPMEHEIEMFRNYARQSVDSIRDSGKSVDAVVWPESMFSAGAPWMIADRNAKVPEGPPESSPLSPEQFRLGVQNWRQDFLRRAQYVQQSIASVHASSQPPHLLVGCGVVHYKDVPGMYSGVISINPDGSLEDWYGKTHLVMFGEYIPIAPHIPGLRSLVPPGMGLQMGPGAKRFMVGDTAVAANICIETAVERVAVNQLARLHARNAMVDVFVTVTNDGWFDDSSVIDHHLRCAQLVAVGCRRPILSAANNGPTAWVDSRGQVVDRLATGANGAVIAAPQRDNRTSVYLRIGDWPARLCVLFCAIILAVPYMRKKRPDAS